MSYIIFSMAYAIFCDYFYHIYVYLFITFYPLN